MGREGRGREGRGREGRGGAKYTRVLSSMYKIIKTTRQIATSYSVTINQSTDGSIDQSFRQSTKHLLNQSVN